jgi:hypothetical protein
MTRDASEAFAMMFHRGDDLVNAVLLTFATVLWSPLVGADVPQWAFCP